MQVNAIYQNPKFLRCADWAVDILGELTPAIQNPAAIMMHADNLNELLLKSIVYPDVAELLRCKLHQPQGLLSIRWSAIKDVFYDYAFSIWINEILALRDFCNTNSCDIKQFSNDDNLKTMFHEQYDSILSQNPQVIRYRIKSICYVVKRLDLTIEVFVCNVCESIAMFSSDLTLIKRLRDGGEIKNFEYLSQNPHIIPFLTEHEDELDYTSLLHNENARELILRHLNDIEDVDWFGDCSAIGDKIVEDRLLMKKGLYNYLSLNTHPSVVTWLSLNMRIIDWEFLSENPAAVALLKQYPDRVDPLALSCNSAIIEYNYDAIIVSKFKLHRELLERTKSSFAIIETSLDTFFGFNISVWQQQYIQQVVENATLMEENQKLMSLLKTKTKERLYDMNTDANYFMCNVLNDDGKRCKNHALRGRFCYSHIKEWQSGKLLQQANQINYCDCSECDDDICYANS